MQSAVSVAFVVAGSLLAFSVAVAKPIPPREGCRSISKMTKSIVRLCQSLPVLNLSRKDFDSHAALTNLNFRSSSRVMS
jgi:hypothetical protein